MNDKEIRETQSLYALFSGEKKEGRSEDFGFEEQEQRQSDKEVPRKEKRKEV
jgi:hypothetical protein